MPYNTRKTLVKPPTGVVPHFLKALFSGSLVSWSISTNGITKCPIFSRNHPALAHLSPWPQTIPRNPHAPGAGLNQPTSPLHHPHQPSPMSSWPQFGGPEHVNHFVSSCLLNSDPLAAEPGGGRKAPFMVRLHRLPTHPRCGGQPGAGSLSSNGLQPCSFFLIAQRPSQHETGPRISATASVTPGW